jgi:hypothetical protein
MIYRSVEISSNRRRLSVRQRTEELRLQKPLRFPADDFVTLASALFEALAVQNRESPPGIVDEAGLSTV